MEKDLSLNQLYDLYGELLTDKQRDIFERYYFLDLSLGEIADGLNITRQAVHDTLLKSQTALEKFERVVGQARLIGALRTLNESMSSEQLICAIDNIIKEN